MIKGPWHTLSYSYDFPVLGNHVGWRWWQRKTGCSSVVLVARLCLTLCDPVDYNPPGSSIHGILQARLLEWVAMPFSRGSSQPRDWTLVSCIAGRFFTIWATREVLREKGAEGLGNPEFLFLLVLLLISKPELECWWKVNMSRSGLSWVSLVQHFHCYGKNDIHNSCGIQIVQFLWFHMWVKCFYICILNWYHTTQRWKFMLIFKNFNFSSLRTMLNSM